MLPLPSCNVHSGLSIPWATSPCTTNGPPKQRGAQAHALARKIDRRSGKLRDRIILQEDIRKYKSMWSKLISFADCSHVAFVGVVSVLRTLLRSVEVLSFFFIEVL
jgi:hypothetical protein